MVDLCKLSSLQKLVIEYNKCLNNPDYFFKTYCTVKSHQKINNNMINDDYLKEHNIKSINLISDGTNGSTLVIKLNSDIELKIIIMDIHNMNNVIISIVDEYEYKIKVKDRLSKINKIINNLCKNI